MENLSMYHKEPILIKAKGFIMPKALTVIKSCMDADHTEHMHRNLCTMLELNDIPVDDKQKFIAIWMHNRTDYQCGNMNDHQFRINGKHGYTVFRWVPYTLLKDVKEGDVVNVNILGWREYFAYDFSGKTKDEQIFQLELECCQFDDRYSSFGPFEKCLSRMI